MRSAGTVTQPTPDTAPNVHETVLELLKDEARGTLLDLAAGEGALTSRLLDGGFDVTPCDLNPGRFVPPVRCDKVDLNEPLPYRDAAFDFVMCVEVIEHLRNPWLMASECARVLKNTGKLVVTTPNILSVSSRVQFLAQGEHLWFPNRHLTESPNDVYHSLDRHINPIAFPELEHILRENGLTVERVATNAYVRGGLSSRARSMTLLLSPLLRRKMRRRFGQGILSSDELLFGQILIVKAARA